MLKENKLSLTLLSDASRWGKSSDTDSRMTRLKQRQHIISAIRDDLYSQDFLEVETPLLVKTTCPDAHIDSIAVGDNYLITSTEYQIKRMMAGGFSKVFTLTKNFRANDRGRYHSPEFTMLEWARAAESLKSIEDDTVRFIRKAFHNLYPNQKTFRFNGHEIDIMKDWEHITVRQAFRKHLGIKESEDFSLKTLCRGAEAAGIDLPASFKEDKSFVISYLLDQLQSHLGKETPTFLHEWPAYMTSSAPTSEENPFAAERTELYIGGIEIANGFPFLRDVETQRTQFAEQLQRRKERDKPSVAIDERYLESLQNLPQGAGMALGIDRLVMVLTGSERLSDVQAFDWDEL